MDDYWDDDDEEEEDEYNWLEDEPDLENMCIEPGCLADGRFGACGCCGGPLCHMHEEVLAGFCTTCSSSPDFDKMMREIYGEIESELSSQMTPHIETTVTVDDEIPF